MINFRKLDHILDDTDDHDLSYVLYFFASLDHVLTVYWVLRRVDGKWESDFVNAEMLGDVDPLSVESMLRERYFRSH